MRRIAPELRQNCALTARSDVWKWSTTPTNFALFSPFSLPRSFSFDDAAPPDPDRLLSAAAAALGCSFISDESHASPECCSKTSRSCEVRGGGDGRS